jgi:hypothetical protein
LHGSHSAQTGRSTPAGGAQEKGFELIISMMCKADDSGRRSEVRSQRPEEFVPRFAGGHFEGDAPFFSQSRNIGFLRDALNIKVLANGLHEGLVGIGLRAADAMVEMRDDDIDIQPVQDVQQRNRVRPAGHTNNRFCSGRDQSFPIHLGFNFFD